MDIVADNNLVVGSIQHLNMLLDLAIGRSEKLGIPFKRENYKWVLGAKILNEIYNYYYYYLKLTSNEQLKTLYGIKVDVDYYNDSNVQLWENITDIL